MRAIRLWRRAGLGRFWSGEGFHSAGEMQKRSYELAEVLVRNLALDFRPRGFGRDRKPVERLLQFLRHASYEDAGDAAAREWLGRDLAAIVGQFLGPGDWGLAGVGQFDDDDRDGDGDA